MTEADKEKRYKMINSAIQDGLKKCESFRRINDRASVVLVEIESHGFKITTKGRAKGDERQTKMFEPDVQSA